MVKSTDLDLICSHRRQMFQEAGRTIAVLDEMTSQHRKWLMQRLDEGRYLGFIAELDATPVGGIGMMVIDWPPHPNHPSQDLRG